jgi:hypothetical protein
MTPMTLTEAGELLSSIEYREDWTVEQLVAAVQSLPEDVRPRVGQALKLTGDAFLAEADALATEQGSNVTPIRPGQQIPAGGGDPFEFRPLSFEVKTEAGAVVHEPTLTVTTQLVARALRDFAEGEVDSLAREVQGSLSTLLFHVEFALKLGSAKTTEDQIAIVSEAAFMWLLLRLRDPAKVVALFAAKADLAHPLPPEVA